MVVVAGVELALVAAQVADRGTGFERGDDRSHVAAGAARGDGPGGGADVGAIETHADARAHLLDVGLGEAGVGAGGAGLGARMTVLDAAQQQAARGGSGVRMASDHFLDVHRMSPARRRLGRRSPNGRMAGPVPVRTLGGCKPKTLSLQGMLR